MPNDGETALAELMAAVREFVQRDERPVDLPALWAVIQALKDDLARVSASSDERMDSNEEG